MANAGASVQGGDLLRFAMSTDGTVDSTGITCSGFSPAPGLSATGGRLAHGATTLGENAYLSIWYLIAAGSQTGYSAVAAWASNFDDAAWTTTLIRGGNPVGPFDPNASLGQASVQTGAPPSAVTFSTTNRNDLVFFSFAGDNGMWVEPGTPTVTPSPPWTYGDGAGNSGGAGAATCGTYFQTASAPLSGSTAANAIPLTDGAIFIVDAVSGTTGSGVIIRPRRAI